MGAMDSAERIVVAGTYDAGEWNVLAETQQQLVDLSEILPLEKRYSHRVVRRNLTFFLNGKLANELIAFFVREVEVGVRTADVLQ